MSHSILIVEDDTELQKYLRTSLLEKGYHVFVAGDGLSALKILEKAPADAVVLDMGLPDVSGETVCLEIKKRYPQTYVIFLTAEDRTDHIVHGLSIGADDYMTKPFVVDELIARIQVKLRQENKTTGAVLQVADLILNKKTYEVTKAGKKIALTPKEFRLLEYFMINSNQVLSREQLLNAIWQYHYDIESRVVDIYVGMLRKKIDKNYKKKLIHSVRGFGYVLKDE